MIFAAYYKAEVTHPSYQGKNRPVNNTVLRHIGNGCESFKLILTRLENISDKDMLSFAKEVLYVGDKEFDTWSDEDKINDIRLYLKRDCLTIADCDYLRSKGYMLPYMGVDLFEAGLAIDSTKNHL